MRNLALLASAFAILGSSAAMADDCSGHNHHTGTAVGAVGGGLIGELATHSVVGGLAGAVVGGVAGNASTRSGDCDHQAAEDRAQEHAYNEGYEDRAAEEAAPPPPPDRVYREPGDD